MNLPSKVQLEAERLKRSYGLFVKSAWPIVEQAMPFIPNWHIDFICEYLTALYDLEIQNLIINIPPGHAKSLLSSVLFPPWVWTKTPSARFFCGSHAQDLATRDAVKSRRLIQSEWYQQRFGEEFKMTSDQNVKSRYENNKTGHRISTGVGGWTGHRGTYIVWDDPLDKESKDSDAERKTSNEAVKGSMGTRGDNPKEIRRLLIMQRLHQDDPTGHIIQEMKENADFPRFEQLILPAEYEPKRFFSSIGLNDPREKHGELLFPQLFDAKVVSETKALLGEIDSAGQLQQRPAPAGGAIFLTKWWEGKNRYNPADKSIFNKSIARWIFYDTAFKDKINSDATAEIVFDLLPDYRALLRYSWWGKLQFPQLAHYIETSANQWMYDDKLRGIIIEDKGSGISALQTLEQTAPAKISSLLKPFNPGITSKPGRMRQASLRCEQGCVLLPMPHDDVPWLLDFEDLLFNAPAAKIDDPPDCFSMGILYLEHLLAEGWRVRNGTTKK